ncbi:hypothetical protein KEM52_002034, partial [Ascosphaera acerosa]
MPLWRSGGGPRGLRDKGRGRRKPGNRHTYGWRRWTDTESAPVRLVLLCVGFFLCMDYAIFTLNSLRWPLSPTFTPAAAAAAAADAIPPLVPSIEKVFISATHWNSAAVLQSHWSAALLDLVRVLGPDNVYVSIYESGSWDNSKDLLRQLRKQLNALG